VKRAPAAPLVLPPCRRYHWFMSIHAPTYRGYRYYGPPTGSPGGAVRGKG
jgi:hypothetical protein